MANIVVKDLAESTELDKKAMAAILGGRRGASRYSEAHGYGYSRPRQTQHPLLEIARKGSLLNLK